MKTLMLIAFVAILAVSCGYKSVEKPLGGEYVKFTAQLKDNSIVYGVRNKVSGKVILPAERYQDILYQSGMFLAYEDNRWTVLNVKGENIAPGMTFESVSYGSHYFKLICSGSQYFYVFNRGMFGSALEFHYYPSIDIAFAKTREGYIAYDVLARTQLFEMPYQQIVCATDADGQTAWYVKEGKSFRKIIDGKPSKTALQTWQLNTLKKEAKAANTPWPEGCGFVKVKTLR